MTRRAPTAKHEIDAMDWKGELNAITDRATREAWQSLMSPSATQVKRWQLWYSPGRVFLVPEGQLIDGAEPVQGSTQIPWLTLTLDQLRSRIRDYVWKLPVLDVTR